MDSLKDNQNRNVITGKILLFISWVLFILYCLILTILLFLSRRTMFTYGGAHNLIPFKTINSFIYRYFILDRMNFSTMFINLFGNILAFMPLGFFVPILFKRMNKLIPVAVLSTSVSMLAEIIQYVLGCGSADIDDVILNLIGGVLGFALYRAFRKLIFH